MFSLDTNILFLDDMPSMRELLRSQLKSLGFNNLFEANNGKEGLEVLLRQAKTNKPIQLVISDWHMPLMTGLEFLKQIRSTNEYANLPFVLLTSETDREQVTEAIVSGASQYIVKPFSVKTFAEKLKTVYAKHYPAAS